jgi:prolyl-tRNA editing enzyme YbaK/EbsC (Cys-tRNA(Pro) deacylase)
VLAALERLDVPFELLEIDPGFADTAAFLLRYGVPPERACNTLLVSSRKEPLRHAACVVPASARLDVNVRVRAILGAGKLSFTGPEQTLELTGQELGAVSPFGLPDDMPVLVDATLMEHDWVLLGGGERRFKLKLPPEVFRRLGAEIVRNLGVPRDPPPDPAGGASGPAGAQPE